MMKKEKPRAVIAMSGGVDSSVAAALLQKDGYDVMGVTMEIYDGSTSQPEGNHHACFGPGETQDIEDAARVAKKLGIPYLTVNLKEEYKTNILDFFVKAYQQGYTPNPCVKCNHEMKFGGIGKELAKKGIKYDYFATGHYARVEYNELYKRKVLKKAADTNKDQTYFLAALTTEELQKALFPLGDKTKEEVWKLAKHLVPSVSSKSESQDFIAGGYHQLFNKTNLPGPIVNRRGKVIGKHPGIEYFTIGQRKGLGLASSDPMYVTAKDAKSNTVIVGTKEELYKSGLIATRLNWHLWDNLLSPMEMKSKIRLGHDESQSHVIPLEDGSVQVEFVEPQSAITPGQTIVFYLGDMIAGSGIITRGLT